MKWHCILRNLNDEEIENLLSLLRLVHDMISMSLSMVKLKNMVGTMVLSRLNPYSYYYQGS